jgi:hypothetical protein
MKYGILIIAVDAGEKNNDNNNDDDDDDENDIGRC